jgi:hypothetical protein
VVSVVSIPASQKGSGSVWGEHIKNDEGEPRGLEESDKGESMASPREGQVGE